MITHRSEKCKNGVDCKTQINGVIYSVVNQLTFHQQFWYQLGIRIPNCELKCGVGEDSWESWTARRSNQSILRKSALNIHWKDWCWSWNSNILATWCKELTHLKRPWCWKRLKAGEERDDRGWGGWMTSPTQWTWVQVNSRSWWRTGRPAVLQSMGWQRVGHNWATELNWLILLKRISSVLTANLATDS